MTAMTTRVLLVDDSATYRAIARQLLEAGGLEVVGEAGDGESGVLAARALHPDLVLLDVQLPGIDGFEVARQLADDLGPPVILVSTREAADYGARLRQAPTCGFLNKDEVSVSRIEQLLAGAA